MSSKSKKRSNEYQSDGGFVASDSDAGGRSKRVKTAKASRSNNSSSSSKTDANGDTYWDISNSRRVTISTFRGKTLVSIREYYEKDGQDLPGKKGISLPVEQFNALISHLPDIEGVLSQKGVAIPRPSYGAAAAEERESPSKSGKKKNIDATSDEEEEEEEEEEDEED
ncbi:hypothetical protein PISL3812_07467 [Talaromyces islandicus]|uniref:Transcriptional coactivator p15 (PC4) C-terminal domain-containing protein n=1 Tax=Talaromyces islandicus TaxID=28573 RepID=A0A0U1M4C8_TALIS|nr:hypothetical protein PISL3812_07467 [Talaromyces islandicus]